MNHDLLALAHPSHEHREERGLGAQEGAGFNGPALGGEIAGRQRPSARGSDREPAIPEVRSGCTSSCRVERRVHFHRVARRIFFLRIAPTILSWDANVVGGDWKTADPMDTTYAYGDGEQPRTSASDSVGTSQLTHAPCLPSRLPVHTQSKSRSLGQSPMGVSPGGTPTWGLSGPGDLKSAGHEPHHDHRRGHPRVPLHPPAAHPDPRRSVSEGDHLCPAPGPSGR